MNERSELSQHYNTQLSGNQGHTLTARQRKTGDNDTVGIYKGSRYL
jgi:hypothetical protein